MGFYDWSTEFLYADFFLLEKTLTTHPFGRVIKDLARRCMRYRQAMTAILFRFQTFQFKFFPKIFVFFIMTHTGLYLDSVGHTFVLVTYLTFRYN